jgi:biotin-(acetyl-CoA carboxylase) ligase
MFAGKTLDRDEIARQLIQDLDEQYGQLVDGNLDKLESAWKWRMGLLGKQVEIECVDQLVQGRLDEISFDRIAIKPTEGFPMQILPERIKHITEQL